MFSLFSSDDEDAHHKLLGNCPVCERDLDSDCQCESKLSVVDEQAAKRERSWRRPGALFNTEAMSKRLVQQFPLSSGSHVSFTLPVQWPPQFTIEHTGARLWDAAVILCGFLDKDASSSTPPGRLSRLSERVGHPLRCIELGAGLGVPSFVVGALGHSCVSTDLEHAVGAIAANLSLNADNGRVTARALDWADLVEGRTTVSDFGGPFDLVILADVLWSADFFRLLSRACGLLCSREGAIVSCAQHRFVEAEGFYGEMMAEGFDSQTIIGPEEMSPDFRPTEFDDQFHLRWLERSDRLGP